MNTRLNTALADAAPGSLVSCKLPTRWGEFDLHGMVDPATPMGLAHAGGVHPRRGVRQDGVGPQRLFQGVDGHALGKPPAGQGGQGG